MARLEYLILGPLEVRDGETEFALSGGQQRKLLAILLLHAGEAVSSDRLIDELWGGNPPETATKALQGYVSSLRKQLGPETVETVGAGYRLKVEPHDIDAHQFEQLLAEARPLERGPAVAKLREALALWRGPALADFAYEDFARNEIERLEGMRLAGIERRIDLELALGHHDDLVPELEALVNSYPLRERLRGHLMVALYRSGRQAEALDAYRDARTVLRDELGLEPSEDLQALQRAILAHDPALAAPPRIDARAPAEADGRPQSRRLRHPMVAVLLGLAILGGAIAGVLATRGKASALVAPPNSVARIDLAGTKVESYVGVGRDPRAIAVGLGGVWVANAEDGTVDRLDPATGRLQGQPIGVGGDDLSDIAIGSGSVWVADGNDGTVTRIDPGLDQVQVTIPQVSNPTVAPDPVFFVAYGSHYVWATRGNELLRIDPGTNQIDGRLAIGTPTGLATGGGSVWVTTESEQLLRIDPRTMKLSSNPLPLGDQVSAPLYAHGSLWVIVSTQIHQIDPIGLDTRHVVSAGANPASLAAAGAVLWAVDNFDGELTRVAAGGGGTASVQVGTNLSALRSGPPSGQNLSAVAVGGGSIWVAVSVGH